MIIYTDLDGTLLDAASYSPEAALPAYRAARARGIPIIFCSSKTRAEIEALRHELAARDPFIVENGGAIYIPDGYFPFAVEGGVARDGYAVIEFGVPYERLVAALRQMRAGLPGRVVGFSDLTEPELAADCGLLLSEARRAKQREYDEPFRLVETEPGAPERMREWIEATGLRLTRGERYYHLHGDHDRGGAVAQLDRLLARARGPALTIGLGDSLNDVPLLAAVKLPVLVQKPDGSYEPEVRARVPGVRLAPGVGPRGWGIAVGRILEESVDRA